MNEHPGYAEVEVPPHLKKLFTEVFEQDFGNCKLFLREDKEEGVTDADLWSVMVNSIKSGVFESDENILDDDWKPAKKITWH